MLPNLSPALYRATADALSALGHSARIPVRLNSDEVHCVCYFGRTLANSFYRGEFSLESAPGYGFTYGERGGPFSADLQAALDFLVTNGFVARQPIAAGDALHLEEYLADPSLLEAAAALEASDDDAVNGAAFIVATVRCFLLRPVPLVYNAIHHEPSLSEARIQEMRTGLPLPTRNEVLGDWLHELAKAVELEFPGRGSDPAVLVPIVVDAFATIELPSQQRDAATNVDDDGEVATEIEMMNDDMPDEPDAGAEDQ